jgi:hypothetical protein
MEHGKKLEFQVEFENVDAAEAGRLAEKLKDYILHADAFVEAKRRRTDQSAMDFGTTLGILLAAPSVIEVAKGIASFLQRYQTTSITLKGPSGEIIVKNLTSRRAGDLAEQALNKGFAE